MDIHIGMKRTKIIQLRDELTRAIDATEGGANGLTEVTLYGHVSGDQQVGVLQINNDDMERPEVHGDEIYSEIDE